MSTRKSFAAAVAALGGTRSLKSCTSCLKVFVPTALAQQYCSARCEPTWPAHPDDRRACPTCGTTFTRTCNPHRYCSPGCRESWSREYERLRADQRRGGPPGPRGRRKDGAKRATATALRDEGLTLAAIGERLGLSRQRVHQLLTSRDTLPPG